MTEENLTDKSLRGWEMLLVYVGLILGTILTVSAWLLQFPMPSFNGIVVAIVATIPVAFLWIRASAD